MHEEQVGLTCAWAGQFWIIRLLGTKRTLYQGSSYTRSVTVSMFELGGWRLTCFVHIFRWGPLSELGLSTISIGGCYFSYFLQQFNTRIVDKLCVSSDLATRAGLHQLGCRPGPQQTELCSWGIRGVDDDSVISVCCSGRDSVLFLGFDSASCASS